MIANCQSRLAFTELGALDAAGAAGVAAGAAVGEAGASGDWVLAITLERLRSQLKEMLTPIQEYQSPAGYG